MRYCGKVIGLILGFSSGVGFWAIVAGLLVGHIIDTKIGQSARLFGSSTSRQNLFFITTFQVMGHLTKSKGRVTAADIQVASVAMDRMQLYGDSRLAAQAAFRQGKDPDYPLRQQLRRFRSACFGRLDLIRIFLEIQVQAALADAELHPKEREVLSVIAEELGISPQQFELFIQMMSGGASFRQHSSYDHSSQATSSFRGPTLTDACKVLGVNIDDDAMTVKRAYRKRMSEHHPDKLVAKGLPKEMMEVAKEKAQNIQAAYDLIRKQRGFK